MKQLRTIVTKDGHVELSVATVPIPEVKGDQVLVQVQASPINPSDMGLLFGAADPETMEDGQGPEGPLARAVVPKAAMPGHALRLGKSMPAGNEGSGVVVRAGSAPEAQQLLGRTVGFVNGRAYTQYSAVKASEVLAFPGQASASACASWFVNPFTALGFVETMRLEGHTALVHTAAASNLGQMLLKICAKDGIELVNVVRKEEQAQVLKDLGAKHVVNSSAPTFRQDLTRALSATGATLAFDATGGGRLASQILQCMEAAAAAKVKEYSRYGSGVRKQVYVYGKLDLSPLELQMPGLDWGVGGWLLGPFLQRAGNDTARRFRERVAAEIGTTFASGYTREVSLAEAVRADVIKAYGKKATGEKFLVNPSLGLPAAKL